MSDEAAIRVNFGRPMPVFPLAAVTLMPHAVVQLHVFEERYKQMVTDALDGPGQIAMAVFEGDSWQEDYHGRPPLRTAVCVGQIMQHQRLPDGRYLLAVHGICRGRIVEELPEDEERLYRMAVLEPIGINPVDEEEVATIRSRLERMLSRTRLADLKDAEQVVAHLRDESVPTPAILELLAFTVFGEPELRYQLLAEPNVHRRAEIVEGELATLEQLLRRAAPQRGVEGVKGCSWN